MKITAFSSQLSVFLIAVGSVLVPLQLQAASDEKGSVEWCNAKKKQAGAEEIQETSDDSSSKGVKKTVDKILSPLTVKHQEEFKQHCS